MIYMCVYICLLPTYQYLCHDTIVVRFHDDDGLVSLNLTKGIACCHRLTCKCKETRQGTLNRTQASTWHLEPVIPKQSFHYEGFLTLVIMQMNHLSCDWKYMNHPERVQKKKQKKNTALSLGLCACWEQISCRENERISLKEQKRLP